MALRLGAGSQLTQTMARLWRPGERLGLRGGLELASRLGYAARGLVYLGVGAIGLLAAADLAPRARGASGTLRAWADWPLGLVLIALVGCGLLAFAAWRALQAIFDADHHGTSPRGWAIRAGQAVSGVVYGALALSAFELLDRFEDAGEADEEGSTHAAAAAALALPYGDALLIAAGLVMLGVGLGNVIQGLGQDFAKRLACGPRMCAVVLPLAKLGYVARGLATLPLGVFLTLAGLDARASDAHSFGGALQSLEHQPFGAWILGLIAVGLIAFGLFGFIEAGFRRISPPMMAMTAFSRSER